jgi:glutamate dehydrogenase (NAD(P)+)
LTLAYRDPETGVPGTLVIDRLIRGVAAGGLRIAADVDEGQLATLARNMTAKQAAVGLRIGGAKAGLRMAPDDPRRAEVLGRFVRRLKPLIEDCYSMGPDVNTTMAELEAAAGAVGIRSLKIAVARRLGIPDRVFLSRYQLLAASCRGATVNQLRGAAGVVAALEVLGGWLGAPSPRVAIQGAGNIGGGVAHLLAALGAPVVAWADDEKTLVARDGLDVAALLEARRGRRLPAAASGASAAGSPAVLEADCDVLVLAAISNAIDSDGAARLRCRGVVSAANLALRGEVEDELHRRGLVVIPDLVASAGGSLAVEALYEGEPRVGEDILVHVERRMRAVVGELLAESARRGVPPRRAARERAEARLRDG